MLLLYGLANAARLWRGICIAASYPASTALLAPISRQQQLGFQLLPWYVNLNSFSTSQILFRPVS